MIGNLRLRALLTGEALAAYPHQQPARAHPVARSGGARASSVHFRTANLLNLAATRLRHIAGTAWSTKRYFYIELLKNHRMIGAITAACAGRRLAKIICAKNSGHYLTESDSRVMRVLANSVTIGRQMAA